MAVKVTFTLDAETVEKLRLAAERLRRPKSAVVREAIREFHSNSDRLPLAERKRLLQILDEFGSRRPTRPQAQVVRELAEIRAGRRRRGRLHPLD